MKKINNLSSRIGTHPFQIKLFGIRTKCFLCLLSLIAALNATAQKAYIPNTDDNTVSVIDLTTNTVTTISVGLLPYGVSVTPDGSKVYIANYGDNTVSVINTSNNSVSAPILVGNNPTGICVTPDGGKVYVVNQSDNTVSVISTTSNTVVATIIVGVNPYGVCVSPNGNTAYVGNQIDNTISVINTISDAVTTTISVGNLPTGISVTPDASKIYVVNQYDNNVSVINASNNTVSATINVGNNPYCTSFTPDGSKAFVTNWNDNTVSVINTATNLAVSTFTVGTAPFGVNVSPDGNKVYTSNHDDGTVNINNTSDNSFVSNVSVGTSPSGFGNFIINSLAIGCISAPAPPTISGPNAVCQMINATYTASSPVTLSYTWTVPSGMTLLSGQGTSSISVRIAAGTMSGNITATATNACGTSAPGSYAVSKKPQTPSAISGLTSICSQTSAIYSASSFNASSYNWLLPTGLSISSGTGTSSINVNVTPAFISGTITSIAINACGSQPGATLTVYAKAPAIPGSLTGPTNVCGLTTATYTSSTSVGSTSYSWIVPSGMLITSGAGTSSITVSISGFTNGNISVAGVNACGTGTAKTLTLTQASTEPLAISGPITTCGLTSAVYSVPPVVGSTGYSWTVPSGATISGQGSTSIIASFSTPMTGNVTVASTNGCTTSVIRTLAVSKVLSVPGAISGPIAGLCARDTATYLIAPIAGATGYSWIVPSGMVIISGLGTNSIFVNSISTSTGSVKVSAKNACGNSLSSSLAISCSSPMDINTSSENGSTFLLYPNPAANEFNIDFSKVVNQQVILEMYDLLGNKVMSKLVIVENNYSTVKTTIEQLNKGMYFVKLIDINNKVLFTQRVIKQ